MKELKVNSKIILDKLNGHNKIKDDLLKLISRAPKNSLNFKNEYYNDHIDKLDYKDSVCNDRKWVKVLLPYIHNHFQKCAIKLGYEACHVNDLWFQQYIKGDLHGWHIHGHNYTGVYYLEFPKKSPSTELIDPSNLNKRFTIPAEEGDIVIFPSFVIHRSGRVLENIRKTIVSFNITFDKINNNALEILSNE